jgi:hypothetical protein
MSGFLSEFIPPAGDRVANFRSISFQATLVPHSQYVLAIEIWFMMLIAKTNFEAADSSPRARHINRPLAVRTAVVASELCRRANIAID